MPAIKGRYRPIAVAAAVAAILLTALPGGAYAHAPGQREATQQAGNFNGSTLTSRVTITTSGDTKSSSGTLTVENTNWTPPPCWYEPYWTAKNLKTVMQAQWSIVQNVAASVPHFGSAPSSTPPLSPELAHDQNYYQNGHPYKDFNVAADSKGMWWMGVKNPQMTHDPRSEQCNRPAFWVPNNTTPNIPLAVSPQVLAEYAYGQVHLPPTTVQMSPTSRQTVNLPTWVWTNKGTFKPVSVTAKLPGTGLWATTTAKPVSLHIYPGTQDATFYPASGDCPINTDGSIGTPYNGQNNATPPCGLTYLRSTAATGPFPFKASLTWQVSWTGSGNTGGTLPNGTFGTTTPLTVQEIQTVVVN